MKRYEIIETIGKKYLTSNIENDEFSYEKALKQIGKNINKVLVISNDGKTKHKNLDIRFEDKIRKISVLVETKEKLTKNNAEKDKRQLQAYINYEKELTNNKIIAIIVGKADNVIKIWVGQDIFIDDNHILKNQYELKTFDEYADIYLGKKNDKEQVIKSTYELNELLHKHGINEKIRSQFVGTCLLALKYNLIFENNTTSQILAGIEEIITNLLEKNLNKSEKLVILKKRVLLSQDVKKLDTEALQEILRKIYSDILPYINDKNKMGQDILNLFFTTFNKYVGKTDRNQAFTPDHISHFMCKVIGIGRNSVVLDPCCGSGAFLVRAMTEAMADCSNEKQKNKVKEEQIYGIEDDETAFGLSTTNMLIHGDGNSNIIQSSCFDCEEIIEKAGINRVLMNPPYNAQKRHCLKSYGEAWKPNTKEDPSQGFHYVHWIASKVKTGRLAVLLPMQCAIGSSSEIKKFKEKMLEEHTLDAVFSLPSDMFHPGASVCACCMVFNLGTRHKNAQIKETFFGYFKDDGFIKKKNLGRVEKTKKGSNIGIWEDIENHWLELYFNRKTEQGLSVTKQITADDEWLAEAYMETDYSKLTDKDFEQTIRDFLAYQISSGKRND